jgi:hypothetical protein
MWQVREERLRALVGRHEGKNPLGRSWLYGRILKWIIRKLLRRAWTGLVWLRIGTNGGLL